MDHYAVTGTVTEGAAAASRVFGLEGSAQGSFSIDDAAELECVDAFGACGVRGQA